MASILIYGNKSIVKPFTKALKAQGNQPFTITPHQDYDPNSIHIHKDIFALQQKDLPAVSYAYYFPVLINDDLVQYKKSYIHGLCHLLQLLPTSTKVILGSSEKVYDDLLGQTVTENTLIQSDCPKSRVIQTAEKQVINSQHPYTILRMANVYYSITDIEHQIKQQTIGYSQRQHMVNQIHINDCINALLHLAPYQGTYNVTDRGPLPLNTILSLISARSGLVVKSPKRWINRAKGVRLSPAKLLGTGFHFETPSMIGHTETEST